MDREGKEKGTCGSHLKKIKIVLHEQKVRDGE